MVNNLFNSTTNYKQKIKEDVKKRGINCLVHFTSIKNLPNIINNGLFSIDNLEQSKVAYDFNDTERLEGYSNSISLSVMFPNYRMFSKYRIYSDNPKDMVVLVLNVSILWEKDCAFYYNNAANKVFNDISASSLKSFEDWENMFCDDVDNNLRSNLNIPDYYTTSPQAEILCFENIEPKYISKIHFPSQEIYNKYKNTLPAKENFYYLPGDLFSARKDYQYWKK